MTSPSTANHPLGLLRERYVAETNSETSSSGLASPQVGSKIGAESYAAPARGEVKYRVKDQKPVPKIDAPGDKELLAGGRNAESKAYRADSVEKPDPSRRNNAGGQGQHKSRAQKRADKRNAYMGRSAYETISRMQGDLDAEREKFREFKEKIEEDERKKKDKTELRKTAAEKMSLRGRWIHIPQNVWKNYFKETSALHAPWKRIFTRWLVFGLALVLTFWTIIAFGATIAMSMAGQPTPIVIYVASAVLLIAAIYSYYLFRRMHYLVRERVRNAAGILKTYKELKSSLSVELNPEKYLMDKEHIRFMKVIGDDPVEEVKGDGRPLTHMTVDTTRDTRTVKVEFGTYGLVGGKLRTVKEEGHVEVNLFFNMIYMCDLSMPMEVLAERIEKMSSVVSYVGVDIYGVQKSQIMHDTKYAAKLVVQVLKDQQSQSRAVFQDAASRGEAVSRK